MTSTPTLPARPVVAITGCRRGLGRALAGEFAAAGSVVIAHARTAEQAEAIAAEISGSVQAVGGDLRDRELGLRIARAAEPHGGVDLLILNAGVLGTMGPLLDASPDEVAEVLDVNVSAQVPLVQAMVPGMISRGRGAVLWLSSWLGRFGLPGYGAYSASKHGAEGLMKILAEEHASDGIVSAAIDPGMVQTDMLRSALGTDDVSEHQAPEAVARGFVALARGLNAEHNGQTVEIAGWMNR